MMITLPWVEKFRELTGDPIICEKAVIREFGKYCDEMERLLNEAFQEERRRLG